MLRLGSEPDGKSAAAKEPRGAKFLEKDTLTLHDACNALRFTLADGLRNDITTRQANMVVGGAREIRRLVETAARITEPTAKGLRQIVLNDTAGETADTTSEELARLEAMEADIARRRKQLQGE